MLLALPTLSVRAERNVSRTPIGRADHAIFEPPADLEKAGPSINGRAAIVVELKTGTVLYAKNIHTQMYPASTTKVLTGLMAVENLALSDSVPISHTAANMAYSGLGSNWEGRVLTAEEALYGLLLRSVNGLGHALAEKMGGSVENFAAMMNRRAAQAGALQTHFTNPHGLNDTRHVTTAYDMAKIMWDAIEIDDFRRISGTYSYTCSRSGWSVTWEHTMCPMTPTNYWYDTRVVCGKTGWTEDALQCRAIYARDGQRDLIICLFYSDDTVESDVRTLLNYGFSYPAPSGSTMLSDYRLQEGCVSGFEPGTTAETFRSHIRFPGASGWVLTDEAGVKKQAADTMKTGDRIWIRASDGSPWYSASAVLYGDVNGDGMINISDLIKVRNHILGENRLQGAYSRSADVSRDSLINISDLIKVRNHILGENVIPQKD